MASIRSGVRSTDLNSQAGAGHLARLGEVVVQAGQPLVATELRSHDLRSDAALADQQTLLHQFLDGLPSRRPGQAESSCQRQLVLEPITRREGAGRDRILDRLGELVVERHRRIPLERDVDLLGHRRLSHARSLSSPA